MNSNGWRNSACCNKAWEDTPKAERGPEPKAPALLTSDGTPETVAELLSRSSRGLLMHADELSGWLASMDRYGGKGTAARAFWLSAYQGGFFRQDRIGRGTVSVDNLSASVLGGIQPDKLVEMARINKLTSDGLLQRFIPILIGPAKSGIDRPPSPCRAWYQQHIAALLDLGPRELVLTMKDTGSRKRCLRGSRKPPAWAGLSAGHSPHGRARVPDS